MSGFSSLNPNFSMTILLLVYSHASQNGKKDQPSIFVNKDLPVYKVMNNWIMKI